jgi:hypothetical protein
MVENLTPRRRRFQFSLRTLLVGVTLLAAACGYVGWQATIVRERKALLLEIFKNKGSWYPSPFVPAGQALSHRSPIRWLLNDWYCTEILIPSNMEGRADDIRSLFPDTDIYFNTDFPNLTMKSLDPNTWPPPRYRAGQ